MEVLTEVSRVIGKETQYTGMKGEDICPYCTYSRTERDSTS